MRETFKGGKAIFTQPPPPIKCGGGPQKIVYLCNDYWRKNNVNAEVKFFSSAPTLFAHKYYSDALQKHADNTNIKTHYNNQLISVDEKNATFKDTITGQNFTESYDFLHVVPHMEVPNFLKNSKISNSAGFVDINMDMNHKIYKNIWAVGDCIALPNAKTAASVFSQVPIVVKNLENYRVGMPNDLNLLYDGYASCPLFVGDDKLMLAEFRDYLDEEGNKKSEEKDESFLKNGQNIPKKEFYKLTLGFTDIYKELSLKGFWFGKHALFNPTKNGTDFRFLYKWLIIKGYRRILLLILFGLSFKSICSLFGIDVSFNNDKKKILN
jgi:NADPH-dependent 2,4-dienoyl-CoA reductase/sulfur reductase-like enzyme